MMKDEHCDDKSYEYGLRISGIAPVLALVMLNSFEEAVIVERFGSVASLFTNKTMQATTHRKTGNGKKYKRNELMCKKRIKLSLVFQPAFALLPNEIAFWYRLDQTPRQHTRQD